MRRLAILLLLCTLLAGTASPSKCATSPYIKSDKVKFHNQTLLKCVKSPEQPPQAVVVNSVSYGSLTCTEEGWRGNGTIIAPLDPPLSVTCANYCEVAEGPGVIVDYQSGRTLVTCKLNENFNHMFFNTDTKVMRGVSFCVLDLRWTDGPELTHNSQLSKDTVTPAKLECRKEACAVQPTKWANFDPYTNKLTCGVDLSDPVDRNRLMAIELNTTKSRFTSLKCDEAKGWFNGSEKVAETGEPLNVTCVEYCASFGDNINAQRVFQGRPSDGQWLDEVVLGCNNASLTLLYEDSAVCNASCRLEGWKIGNSSIHEEPSKYPQRFDCRVFDATPITSTGTPEKGTIAAQGGQGEGTSLFVIIGCIFGIFGGILIGAVIGAAIFKFFFAKKPCACGGRRVSIGSNDALLDEDSVLGQIWGRIVADRLVIE